jgi:RNA polymerase sigma factor (sigma-70 family)
MTLPLPITIAIADDHLLFTESLEQLLFSNERFRHSFSISRGEQLLTMLQQHQPTVLILDINLPPLNGLQLISDIRNIAPRTRILILSMHQPEEFGLSQKDFEADGYVLKTSGKVVLEAALKQIIHSTELYCTPDIRWQQRSAVQEAATSILTRREKQIIKMILAGKTTREIAEELYISEHTVKTHRSRIREKLSVSGVGNLINKMKDATY